MSDTTTLTPQGNKSSSADYQPESIDAIGEGKVEISHWEYDDDDGSSVIRGID